MMRKEWFSRRHFHAISESFPSSGKSELMDWRIVASFNDNQACKIEHSKCKSIHGINDLDESLLGIIETKLCYLALVRKRKNGKYLRTPDLCSFFEVRQVAVF